MSSKESSRIKARQKAEWEAHKLKFHGYKEVTTFEDGREYEGEWVNGFMCGMYSIYSMLMNRESF